MIFWKCAMLDSSKKVERNQTKFSDEELIELIGFEPEQARQGAGRSQREHPSTICNETVTTEKFSNGDRYSETIEMDVRSIGKTAESIMFDPCWVPVPFPQSPIWTRLGTHFNPEHFSYCCPPVDTGPVTLELTSMDNVRTLRCPIKISGSREVVLPSELAALRPLIRHVCELEAHAAPEMFENFWCHVSFERTEVTPGLTQRVPGWHVDGFQGVRVPRHRIEHSYLWSDGQPTQYCLQPFYLSHLDPGRHNVFAEMQAQAREVNAVAGFPEHVYLVDPYLVHRSPTLVQGGWRSFARVTFTQTELEDPGNTRNESLGASQDYPARIDARDRLHAYKGDVPWDFYGVKRL